MIGTRMVRIPAFIASDRSMLPDEFNANRLSAAPDHGAVPSGPGVARERQSQFPRQYIGIIHRELGARGRDILHHRLARREATFECDLFGVARRFVDFPLLGRSCHSNCTPKTTALRRQALETVAALPESL